MGCWQGTAGSPAQADSTWRATWPPHVLHLPCNTSSPPFTRPPNSAIEVLFSHPGHHTVFRANIFVRGSRASHNLFACGVNFASTQHPPDPCSPGITVP